MADNRIERLDDLSPRAKSELKAWILEWSHQQPTDATVNAGTSYGVRSVNVDSGNVPAGKALVATGDGGSEWGVGALTWEKVGNDCVSCGGGTTIPDRFATTVVSMCAANNLLGYWRLGESASPFADSNTCLTGVPLELHTGSTYHITPNVAGGLSTEQDDGAVFFSATGNVNGDYLQQQSGIADSRFQLSTTMSVSFWFKPPVLASAFLGHIVQNGGAGVLSGLGWWVIWSTHYIYGNDQIVWERRTDGAPGSDMTTQATVTPDVWSFIVATYGASTGMKLYVNGTLMDSDATTFTISPVFALKVGEYSGNNNLLGTVDELAVWGSELSAADITTLYNNGI